MAEKEKPSKADLLMKRLLEYQAQERANSQARAAPPCNGKAKEVAFAFELCFTAGHCCMGESGEGGQGGR